MTVMSKDALQVRITIKSLIKDEAGVEETHQEHSGLLHRGAEATVLRFSEGETKPEEIHNFITIKQDIVSIKRQGFIEMFQKFRHDALTENIYKHPHGSIHMETLTNDMKHSYADNNGVLSLKYEVKLNGAEARSHTFELTYQEEDSGR